MIIAWHVALTLALILLALWYRTLQYALCMTILRLRAQGGDQEAAAVVTRLDRKE